MTVAVRKGRKATYAANVVLRRIRWREKQMRRTAAAAFAWMIVYFDEHIEQMIEEGSYEAAVEEVAVQAAQGAAVIIYDEFARAFRISGEAATEFIEEVVEEAKRFDIANDTTMTDLQNQRDRIAAMIVESQRTSIHLALRHVAEAGFAGAAAIAFVRLALGLTERQFESLVTYLGILRQAPTVSETELLARQLRDPEFDPLIRQAADLDDPLTPKQIDRILAGYARNQLKFRADVIGQTEAVRAVHMGNFAAYRQAVEEGTLDPWQITRKWHTTRDGRERVSHALLDGLIRELDDAFPGLDSLIRFPGDPDAAASETINCRCSLETIITLVEEGEFEAA